MAERVTARGREILNIMLDFLIERGAVVIEMDTDGIYFQPPENENGESLKKDLAKRLPAGIDVDFDASYKRMFSYKSKNYALLKENNELLISGAALKSRGLEPFQRRYIREVLYALLEKDAAGIRQINQNFERDLKEHRLPLQDLVKSETLSESVENYRKKMQSGGSSFRRSAAYEAAIRSGKEYRQGDQITFYATGSKKRITLADHAKLFADADPEIRDENVEYYLWELEELRKKFQPFADRLNTENPEQQMEFQLES